MFRLTFAQIENITLFNPAQFIAEPLYIIKMEASELILKPRKSKVFKLGFISIVFVSIGIYLINIQGINTMNILCTSFFSLGIIVSIIQVLPGSTELKLNQEGFYVTSLYRQHFTKWTDIKKFKVGRLGPNKAVLYDYVDGHKKFEIGKSIAKNLSKSHAALPDNYGLKTNELRSLMENWRKKYTSN